MTITVFVRGLEVFAKHGVLAEERVVGHRFLVDLELDTATEATETDQIDSTVDYAEAALLVQSTLRDSTFQTVERAGKACVEALFRQFPTVIEIRISLAKRLPAGDFMADQVGIRLQMCRTASP